MKYLDERVIFTMPSTSPSDSILQYRVYYDGDVIFIGNAFFPANKKLTLDVTDIIKNFVDVDKPPFILTGAEESYNVKYISVKVLDMDGNDIDEAGDDVFMGYRQPLYQSYVTTEFIDNSVSSIGFQPMLQGWSGTAGYLIPTYPAVASDIFTFDMLANYQNLPLIQSYTNIYKEGTIGPELFNVSFYGGSFMRYSRPMSAVLGNFTQYTPCDAEYIAVTTFSPVNPGQRYTVKIAKLDGKSRYFLKWKDRYGMPQCQPFGGTYTYSEETTKSKIETYTNKTKLTGVQIQPIWKLNSNWINEKYMPFYESIFVSPYLILFDAKENKQYDVILENSEYVEKTFNNQGRQLFNLQLDVKLDTKQNMLY